MSMMSIGLSGLIAAQKHLEATSNNVANAGTEGFVRRRVLQAAVVKNGVGTAANLGTGVRVTSVERLYDQFLVSSLRGAHSSEQRAQVLTDLTARLDGMVGNPENGIASGIQAFFDQVEALGRTPTSAAARQQLLMQGESLATRFQQLGRQLDAFTIEVDRRIDDSIARINTIAQSIASINDTIGRGAISTNDLMDQRDALLAELTRQIDATVLEQEDGRITVMIGNGQPLVLGSEAGEILTEPDAFDPTQPTLLVRFQSASIAVGRQIAGGALGGLLAFKSDALGATERELDLLATTLAQTFNAQHQLGVDANGDLGGAFFATPTPEVAGSTANSGTGALSATVADAAALTARDYELRFDGSTWQLFDATTRAPLALAGTGTAADPLRFDGLAVTVGGSAAAGDRFRVRPVGDAAARFALTVTDPDALATAAPVGVSRSLGNASEATIAFAAVSDIADPALRQPAQIRFDSPGVFRIYDSADNDLSGPLAYASGSDISFNGWTVRISGTPATGDRFDVRPTPPDSADNGNALALAAVASRGFLDNGRTSVNELSARLISGVGATALRNSQELGVQATLREQLELDVDAVSGVNLDEEAANMLRFQQSYQAAAKIIGVADELFLSLLGLLR
jgi:flagellar hook-associated protein 1 FlgK